jgi:mono/diheme cytochrome c family protein
MAYRGRLRGLVLALGIGLLATYANAQECKEALRDTKLVPTDHALCKALTGKLKNPSAMPLDEYEETLSKFFDNWCHRDEKAGWVRDKFVRDTGPYTATRDVSVPDGQWQGAYHGTHAPVVIWYSPDMLKWLEVNRPEGKPAPKSPAPIPQGAMMVKEMYPAPAAACAKYDPLRLWPTSGAAIMIRDADASKDGWFWGWYGWPGEGWKPDWPAGTGNTPPNMGFGQYCVNCHGSAHDMTFADLRNIQGFAGHPEVFLSQDFFANQYLGSSPGIEKPNAGKAAASVQDVHALRAAAEKVPDPIGQRRTNVHSDLDPVLASAKRFADIPEHHFIMPSQTYDTVWMPADGPNANSQFLTSDQCVGCHDAGSTGLQFDMTAPDPKSKKLLDFSPYATWRTSPMGLAGRDPIFFAQMASETQTFHHDSADLVQTTCLGCHGIQGQRQFQIDQPKVNDECAVFDRNIVNATPYPPGGPGAMHASYGALARDGISCQSCHQMVLGKEAEKYADDPQNACVLKRQAELNPDNTGFGKTFTGSFLVGPADKLFGPFDMPKTHPMEYTLGITPEAGKTIKTSELCGSCHTVHLPVLDKGKTLAHIYEQTTYAEWAFSAYRTGDTVFGKLPEGAGATPQSCQDCHMPSKDEGGQFNSKIASIQEYSNFPSAEHTFDPVDIDLEQRKGFARHTLVGLNLFLVKMFQQFPAVMGVPTEGPMLTSKGVDPLEYTARAISDQAQNGTASIALDGAPKIAKGKLSASIHIENHTGHKFPSGVGFRRAFVNFKVFDAQDKVIWESGKVNKAGVLIDQNNKPIDGELWWKDDCSARIDPLKRAHQPHFQVIKHQNEAQIYQELVSAPPKVILASMAPDAAKPAAPQFACGHNVKPRGELTTSFLSICSEVKDNRLSPHGYLPLKSRVKIAKALGAGEDLAEDVGFTAVGIDPDYIDPAKSGGDHLRYEIDTAKLKGKPAYVRATLYYQATPPFYLQDRFCTAKGDDADRLAFLVQFLNLDDSRAESWSLKLVETGKVSVTN